MRLPHERFHQIGGLFDHIDRLSRRAGADDSRQIDESDAGHQVCGDLDGQHIPYDPFDILVLSLTFSSITIDVLLDIVHRKKASSNLGIISGHPFRENRQPFRRKEVYASCRISSAVVCSGASSADGMTCGW